MEFFEAVERRRSCRKFLPEVVPAEVIEKALSAALLAPNTSNIQPWEFYWVRGLDKKAALAEACLSQNAARTAGELVVAVSRIDTWKRNRELLMEILAKSGNLPSVVRDYYNKIIPLSYIQGPLSVLGWVKYGIFSVVGLFRPVPRGPASRQELFEVVTKTTALACENFMLAISAQGYDSCPMEGFDAVRVKKLLGLNRNSHVVMVLGVGKADPTGIFGERARMPESLFIHKV